MTQGPRLRLVCVNDVYILDNLPRLATFARSVAAEDPGALVLTTLAGDFVSPSLLSSLDCGRGMIDCMNAVPITHVIFGNHEDDIAIAELRKRVREFKGTWISTNVLGFDPPLPPAVILDVGRPGGVHVRVGLVGVVMDDPTTYKAPPFGGATTLPANDAAVCAARHLLTDERCDLVIPLTHQTMESDRALARSKDPRFPLIVGGHEHVVEIEQVDGCWIVKAGADAVKAALVDVTWPAEGGEPTVDVHLVDLAGYAEDAALRARVDQHMQAVVALEQATLMTLPDGAVLSSVGTRHQQTSLGTLVASLVRDACGADVGLFNGGGLRGGRDHVKRFTYGDLRAEVPFDNELVVVDLPGSVVAAAIATSRADAPVERGGFLQVDDKVEVDAHDAVLRLAGAPLDPARLYKVVLIRDLFGGMDHNAPLVAFAKDFPAAIPAHGSGREAKLVLLDAFSRALLGKLGDVDENHDGTVDAAEVARAVTRFTQEPASKLTVELLMKAIASQPRRG